MTRLAFVFPGQGSQSVGMGAALASAWPQAAAVLAEADTVLGERLGQLISAGPAAELDRTENAQPALLAVSIGFLHALYMRATDEGGRLAPSFAAGHSMGQYSALVAAGSISLADGLRLVRERGRLMQASGEGRPGAMAAILGLDEDALDGALTQARAFGSVGIANRNAPGQFVLSGDVAAIDAAVAAARERRARKCVVLPITVAAHSDFMADAARGMAAVLADVEFSEPTAVLVANADARFIETADGARDELVRHLTTGVDWMGGVTAMTAAGVDTFIEVGPGRVLTGLIKRIAPDARAFALDDPAAADGLSQAAIDAALDASATGESSRTSAAAPVITHSSSSAADRHSAAS